MSATVSTTDLHQVPASAPASARAPRQPLDVIVRKYAAHPPHLRDPLLWFHAYGHQHNLSTAAMGALIDYDKGVVSKLFSADGAYPALEPVCDAINEAREKIAAEEKSGTRRPPFLETALARHIWKLCDLARDYERIVFCYGPSQIGKSRAQKEKARREPGRTFYAEIPVGGALTHFLANLADATGLSPHQKSSALRRRLIAVSRTPAGTPPVLFLFDQMHRLFSDRHGGLLKQLSRAQIDTLDFLIELFDEGRSGLALFGTEVFRQGLAQLVDAPFFAQLRRRGLNEEGFPLPAQPARGDLRTFARHYGLDAATGEALLLQTRVIETSGLGVWLTRLSMAHHSARKKQRPVAWADVLGADNFLAAAAAGKLAIAAPTEDES